MHEHVAAVRDLQRQVHVLCEQHARLTIMSPGYRNSPVAQVPELDMTSSGGSGRPPDDAPCVDAELSSPQMHRLIGAPSWLLATRPRRFGE